MSWWLYAEVTWVDHLLACFLLALWVTAFFASALAAGYMLGELLRALFRHVHGVRDDLD